MHEVIRLRPLRKTDNREAFDCGQPVLNNWFRRHAWGNEKESASRTYVLVDETNERVAGYVTLATGQLERVFLPKSKQRNKPDPVPILLLGQLAVDQSYQGRGFAVELMRHAFSVSVEVSRSVGAVALVTHPLNDSVQQFYARWGFEPLQNETHQAMMILTKDLELSQ